jgi:hypothetical protein
MDTSLRKPRKLLSVCFIIITYFHFLKGAGRMKNFVRMVMLSAVAAVVSVSWLGCVVDNGTGPSGGTVPRITTATLPNGTAGTPYSQTLKASGDAPITWSLESGALPAGLNLLGSGTISGTPTTAGTYSFSVKAINSAGSDVSSFSVIITGGSTTPTTPTSYSLDGVWEAGAFKMTISGNIGVYSAFGTFGASNAVWNDALSKGHINVGDQCWRNITSTGNLTWSGEEKLVQYNTSNPNISIGTSWTNKTFTMSADGQTLIVGTNTFTRSNHSLDGVWEAGAFQMTISGNTGVYSAFGTFGASNAVWNDALSKGHINVGDQCWRNITSTGNLTWSGEEKLVQYNTSNPNVSIGTSWTNKIFTMSADGQTLTVGTNTFTRKR